MFEITDEYKKMCTACWGEYGRDKPLILAPKDTRRKAPSKQWRSEYYQLIMAVETKFPGETRHETALRYIREAEMGHGGLASKENYNEQTEY